VVAALQCVAPASHARISHACAQIESGSLTTAIDAEVILSQLPEECGCPRR
jgi:hypothetical protein